MGKMFTLPARLDTPQKSFQIQFLPRTNIPRTVSLRTTTLMMTTAPTVETHNMISRSLGEEGGDLKLARAQENLENQEGAGLKFLIKNLLEEAVDQEREVLFPLGTLEKDLVKILLISKFTQILLKILLLLRIDKT